MKTKIGEIGVDAGIVWIGDPCYVFHKKLSELPKTLGKTWLEFCYKLTGLHTSFEYDLGHEGLGVCVSSGYGDGMYPVYAEIEEGIVKSVTVIFDNSDEDDDYSDYDEEDYYDEDESEDD